MDQNITVFMLGCTGSEDYLVANRLRSIDLLKVETIRHLAALPPPPWQNMLLIAAWQNLDSKDRQDILQALAASPTAALIIMAQQLSTEDARGLMSGGLVAILDMPCAAETLEHHILLAAEELRDIRDQLERLHAAESRLSLLTPRERDILRSLVTGLSNKGVARDLNLSPRTVEVHRANMIRRSGARNIAELLQMQFILDRAPPIRATPLMPSAYKQKDDIAPTPEEAGEAPPPAAATMPDDSAPKADERKQPFAATTSVSSAPYSFDIAPVRPNAFPRQIFCKS